MAEIPNGDVYQRSQERVDSLLDRINARLQDTLRELHRGAIEDEFEETGEGETSRQAWEDLWWANRREQRRGRGR